MLPLIELCPRGSYIRNVLSSSELSMNHCRFSAMVVPGMTPTPPVITRVGIPSVWESTAWMTRWVRTLAPVRVGVSWIGDGAAAAVKASVWAV